MFNLDMIKARYAQIPGRIQFARTELGRPLTLAEKILYSHLIPGTENRTYARGRDRT